MSELSLTFREFLGSTEDLENHFGKASSIKGNVGDTYRGRSDTLVRKSFVVYDANLNFVSNLSEEVVDHIHSVGGVDLILSAIGMFHIRSVHIEINLDQTDIIGCSGIYWSDDVVRIISSIGSSIGVSWSGITNRV